MLQVRINNESKTIDKTLHFDHLICKYFLFVLKLSSHFILWSFWSLHITHQFSARPRQIGWVGASSAFAIWSVTGVSETPLPDPATHVNYLSQSKLILVNSWSYNTKVHHKAKLIYHHEAKLIHHHEKYNIPKSREKLVKHKFTFTDKLQVSMN